MRGALLAALLGGVLAAGGCGGGGSVGKDAFITGFVTRSGLSHDQAVCATDHLFAALSADEIRRIHDAGEWGGLSVKERNAITAASAACVTGTSSTATGDTTPAGSSGTDASTGTTGTVSGDPPTTGTTSVP